MKQLYSVCRTKRKFWREFTDGSHNDTVAEPGYFNYIDIFIREVVNGKGEMQEKL
jgi:abhydrolase domain-containing protein 13